jgi:hypothetical protein
VQQAEQLGRLSSKLETGAVHPRAHLAQHVRDA